MNSKFRRTEAWQRAGSTGVCWQAHTETVNTETIKQEHPKVPTPTPFRSQSTCRNILQFSDFILET